MKKQLLLLSALLLIGLASVTSPITVSAKQLNPERDLCTGSGGTYSSGGGGKCTNKETTSTVPELLGTATEVLLFLVGIIAVIMILIGGFKYATSGGDQSAVNSAKTTIISAIIGLIIAFVAYAIVNFVLVELF